MSTLTMKRLKVYVHSKHTMDNATKIYTGDGSIPGVDLTLVIDPKEARQLIDTLIDGLSGNYHAASFEVRLQGTIKESE